MHRSESAGNGMVATVTGKFLAQQWIPMKLLLNYH
jgi:hypothetical protein